MKSHVLLLLLIPLLYLSCDTEKKSKPDIKEKSNTFTINPIPIDIKTLSGLDLKAVTNKDDPERRLFQKRLLRGLDLSVYVVSSETASTIHESYGIDEFLYIINGRARLNPKDGKEVFFNTGDFFLAPKGYNGEWETQGGNEFLIELSVITTQRAEEEIDPSKTLPYLIDKAKLSGIGISQIGSTLNQSYHDKVYQGAELEIAIHAEKPDANITFIDPIQEQFVYVISGAVKIRPEGGDEFVFNRGDFYLLPKGFIGIMETKGHGLFRSMVVKKSRNMKK